MAQPLIFTSDLESGIHSLLSEQPFDRLFVLTDRNSTVWCYPAIKSILPSDHQLITIEAGDDHKDLEALSLVWQSLQKGGATRASLLINLGGGMVTDLGGFAAASFKRGIRFYNLPTTLLSAVDAAVGGKTGINFGGLKNEIGAFAPADGVLIAPQFWKTLPKNQLYSGYAEMLKHALLKSSETLDGILSFDWTEPDFDRLLDLVKESVKVKEEIVTIDPKEKGLRKALNLGHTTGHAFESLAFARNSMIEHGYGVAWGVVCELFLSVKQCNFPPEVLTETARFVRDLYGYCPITCDDYEQLIQYMRHDKKNEGEGINFTLLRSVGDIQINCTASPSEITEALDYLREGI